MAHHHNNSAYGRLVERLNRFPQGAPPSKLLFGILKILFSEEEAGLVAELPIKPFTVNPAARAWQRSPAEARKILDEQTPAGSFAAPVPPARKPHSRWRMVLGGGLAVLVLGLLGVPGFGLLLMLQWVLK